MAKKEAGEKSVPEPIDPEEIFKHALHFHYSADMLSAAMIARAQSQISHQHLPTDVLQTEFQKALCEVVIGRAWFSRGPGEPSRVPWSNRDFCCCDP